MIKRVSSKRLGSNLPTNLENCDQLLQRFPDLLKATGWGRALGKGCRLSTISFLKAEVKVRGVPKKARMCFLIIEDMGLRWVKMVSFLALSLYNIYI